MRSVTIPVQTFEGLLRVESTYSLIEVADVQPPEGSLLTRGGYWPESSHWRSDRLGAPNDRYEAVTASSPCGHEQQQSLHSRRSNQKRCFCGGSTELGRSSHEVGDCGVGSVNFRGLSEKIFMYAEVRLRQAALGWCRAHVDLFSGVSSGVG